MPKSYEDKRDFDKTPEPAPGAAASESGALIFCIQKHAARRLHYDLRLEIDGVLASWAVPKGPSVNPADKHLAVHVEDHPLSYATFEGQIPKGEYGGGEIIVWDMGTYSPDEYGKLSWDDKAEANRRMREGVREGKLSFTLRGSKLQGSWTLVKTKGENEWLLIKHKDEFVSTTRDVLKEDRSILSGRTVEDVAAGREAGPVETDLSGVPGAQRATMPRRIDPMLATEAAEPFDAPEWLFEVKIDGIRVIALVEDRRARLYSRNGKDISAKFPALARELAAFPHDCFILDGEIVLYDEKGVPDFQLLMERFQRTNPREIERFDQSSPIEYCVFDLLYLDGWDLRQTPLFQRRKVLEGSLLRGASTRILDAYPEQGKLLFEHAKKLGFEGVVGKKQDSRYREGTRTPAWVKVKGFQSEDFIIVGYTKGSGMRATTFGSLVLGAYQDGKLEYRGNVGGGFSDQQLEDMSKRLDALPEGENPFGIKLPLAEPVRWVAPQIWAEVKFMMLTKEGRLRAPVFLRLRPDLAIPAVANHTDPEAADAVEAALEQLAGTGKEIRVQVEGCEIRFSNLDKELWPATSHSRAFTKRDLAIYYAKASRFMLPHLKNRPLSFVRCPNGIYGEQFFQKHWEAGLPDFVERVDIWSSSNSAPGEYVMVNNLATLMWLAQLATLEIHPWYSRITGEPDALSLPADTATSEESLEASALNYPDFLVIDLDPNIRSGKERAGDEPELNEAAFRMTVEVALGLKEMLDDLGFTGYLKTSGKTGLHVYLSIERNLTYDIVRKLCETLGLLLLRRVPDKVTMEWVVSKRPEKIFFDHNQNVRGKTLVSIFSPRPVPGAPVSFPVDWGQLASIYPMQFTIESAPGLLAKSGDKWRDILERRHDLRRMLS